MLHLNCKALKVLVAMLAATTICAARTPDGTFQKTYQMNGAADLQVFTRSGDITIRTGPAGSISISGKIYVGNPWLMGDKHAAAQDLEKNPPIRQTGNRVVVDYVNQRNVAIDYEITVPADTALKTKTGSGDQTIEGLERGLDVESGSGDFRLRDIKGQVALRTGSGDVEAQSLAGAFEATAGSGDIRLDEQGSGNVRIHTGSGNVEAHNVDGSLAVETGSGDLRADGKLAGPWEVRTGSGDVEIRLPGEATFDLDATTSSGDVTSDHPVTMTVQGRVQGEHKSVKGKVNGGGTLLLVHTGSGDVHIY
jgi:hypothetical protein